MAVFGIVSEFNPFHKGHKYLVECARSLGASAVVSVMSGRATQRGELAAFDKYLRAECAVKNGVDLVCELPYPFSSSSAEFFARGAVSILQHMCDTIIFGSECGDIELLRRAADFVASERFAVEYRERLSAGEQSAAAYISLLSSEVGATFSSNDILGIEYIKAAKQLGSKLDFVTVKRVGGAYNSDELCAADMPDSAMAIRKLISAGKFDSLSKRLPNETYETLCGAYERGEYINQDKYFESARFYFRLADPVSLSGSLGLEGGLAERVCRAARESSSGVEFFELLSTKRYTDAKLRRSLLFAMTGVSKEDLATLPAYTNLLGADKLGRELVSLLRKKEEISIITKPADAATLDAEGAKRQWELSQRLDGIFSFCLENSADAGELIRKKPYIT